MTLKKETVSSIATKIKKLSEQADAVPISSNTTDPTPEETLEEKIAEQEEYYQRVRPMYYFHDLSYIHQTVTVDEKGNNIYKDIIKDYGCGHPDNPRREGQRCWCVPECPYYPEYGRIDAEGNLIGR